MRRSGRLHGDAGASLVLAMAFLVLFGATSVTLLVLTGTSLRVTKVTRSKTAQLYAADGGIEYGIRSLQTDTAKRYCQTQDPIFATFESSPPLVINGKPVTVKCRTTGGQGTVTTTTTTYGSALSTGYAAILGSDGLVLSGAPSGYSLALKGSASSVGNFVDQSVPLTVEKDLAYAPGCSQVPATVTVTGACSPSVRPTPAAPKITLPTRPNPPQKQFTNTCNIIYPGKYTTAPDFAPNKSYYLASGAYYFDLPSGIALQGVIVGGAPGSETVETTKGCATDADAHDKDLSYDATKAGFGVTLIFGGNAGLVPNPSASMELFSRAGVTDTEGKGVTLWAIASPSAGGSDLPSGYKASTASTLFATSGNSSPAVVHGLTYLPDATPSLRQPLGTGGSKESIFMGGIVAKGLVLDVKGNVNPAVTATLAGASAGETKTETVVTPGTRVTLVCAQATTAGGGDMVTEALVQPDTSDPADTVLSWRKVAGC